MKRNLLFALVAVLSLQLAAIAQENPLVRYLPGDVQLVAHLDFRRMAAKVPGEVFRRSVIYQQLMKNPEHMEKLKANPQITGVDLSAGIILAVKKDEAEKKEPQYNDDDDDGYRKEKPLIYIFGKLKDAEAFTRMIVEVTKNDDEEERKISVFGTDRIYQGKDQVTLGWNNDIFVLAAGGNIETPNIWNEMTPMVDTFSISDSAAQNARMREVESRVNQLREKMQKAQRDRCFMLLEKKAPNALTTNNHFMELFATSADMKFWSDGSPMKSMPKQFAFLESLMNNTQSLIGKNRMGTVNFEAGKIVATFKNYPSEEMAAILSRNPPVAGDMDILRRIPQENLLALFSINVSQPMIDEVIKKLDVDHLVDSLKNKIPFDINLALGTFKSSATAAVMFKKDFASQLDEGRKQPFDIILAIPIANRDRFEKLKAAVMPHWEELKKEKATAFEKIQVHAKNNDQLLVISMNEEMATAFLNNNAGEIPASLKPYTGYPNVAMFDFKKLLGMMLTKRYDEPLDTTELTDHQKEQYSSMKEYEKKMMERLGSFVAYGGKYENGSVNSTAEFSFRDPTENAMKQWFDWLNDMVGMRDNSRFFREDDTYTTDTTTVTLQEEVKEDSPEPPPPPTVKISEIKIPVFKNPVIQKYANEYAAIVNEFVAAKSNPEKFAELSTKMSELAKRSTDIGKILAEDPDEAKKFSDWVTKLAQYMSQAFSPGDESETKEAPVKKVKPKTTSPKPGKH